MKIAGRSDIGLVRSNNQDNYVIVENLSGDTLALVCDGIGGAKAGDVASLMVIKYVGKSFSTTETFSSVESARLWLIKVIHQANDELFEKTLSSPDFQGMGTTLVGALFFNSQVLVMNVGDSRAYTLKDNELKQVTKDHSLVNDLLDSGQIDLESAKDHPQRNILTNALGVSGPLKIDLFNVVKGEKLLLCSDGLSGYVDSQYILDVIKNDENSIEEMLAKLIIAANDAGGYDNITAIIADLGGVFSE